MFVQEGNEEKEPKTSARVLLHASSPFMLFRFVGIMLRSWIMIVGGGGWS